MRGIVIGASAGGFDPLKKVVSQLPAGLPVPVFVVLHVPPYQPSFLPEILTKAGSLPAVHPADGAKIEGGVIYVAPPDHHLLIEDGRVAVKKGPKENHLRPSVDALFRSAAYVYGAGAIGVLLSGALDDGTSGLWSLKRLGGVAIVQDPDEARVPSMPASALKYIVPDYVVTSAEIGRLLGRLAHEQGASEVSMEEADMEEDIRKRLGKEMRLAAGDTRSEKDTLDMGSITPFTCPECQGSLIKITEGKLERFRCYTGHAYSESALLEAVTEATSKMLWQVIRGLKESAILLTHIGQHLRDAGEVTGAEKYLAKARGLEQRADAFHDAALSHQSLSVDNLNQAQPGE